MFKPKSSGSAVKGGIAVTPAKPGGVTGGAPMMKKGGNVKLKDLDDDVPKNASKSAAVDSLKTSTVKDMKGIKPTQSAADSPAKYAKGGSVEGFKRGPKMSTTMC